MTRNLCMLLMIMYSLSFNAEASAEKLSVQFSVISEQYEIKSQDIAKIERLDKNNMHGVQITFTNSAAKHFKQLTSKNIGRKLQLNVGHIIINTATIRSELGSTVLLVAPDAATSARLFEALK